ncbi:MAG: hypothetical protein L0Y76_08485 [Ignavibacteria bacterium]|nr:hypothetical protein [Ignavibacteria bacterium]
MLLYLHGFASSGNATKARILKEFIQQNSDNINENVVSPDLSEIPEKAIDEICGIIERTDRKIIVFGSSLGGFYATYACYKYNLPAVLINPAVEPHITLRSVIGLNKNYSTGADFEFRTEYLSQLEKFYNEINPEKLDYDKIILMAAEDDTLLDYKYTIKYFRNKISKVILEKKSGHEFMTFRNCLPKVFEFLGYNV